MGFCHPTELIAHVIAIVIVTNAGLLMFGELYRMESVHQPCTTNPQTLPQNMHRIESGLKFIGCISQLTIFLVTFCGAELVVLVAVVVVGQGNNFKRVEERVYDTEYVCVVNGINSKFIKNFRN